MSHPAAGAGGPGTARARHPRGTRTARGWWHPRCNVPMSLLMAPAVPAASWPPRDAAPCTRCSNSSFCCPGGGQHGEVLGGAGDEEQKAEKLKLNPKPRWFQGCVGSLAASPALGRSKMLQQHLHPLLHRGERPVAVPEDRYDLPWGTCAGPSR